MAKTYDTNLKIMANTDTELAERVKLYEDFNNYISIDNLRLLHKACLKNGHEKINKKIQSIKAFL
jgi:hypothetical protein